VDHPQDRVEILEDFVIPETDNPIAQCLDPRLPLYISLSAMLAAVDLDDQICLRTQEIHDERADRCLSAEFKAIKPAVAQGEPDAQFSSGHVATERGGVGTDLAHGGHISTVPSPRS
jgi:hypothetical protein